MAAGVGNPGGVAPTGRHEAPGGGVTLRVLVVGDDAALLTAVERVVGSTLGVEVVHVDGPERVRQGALPDARVAICAARTAWAITPATVAVLRLACPTVHLALAATADHPAVAGVLELGFDDLMIVDGTIEVRIQLLIRRLERDGGAVHHRTIGAAVAERVGLGLLTMEPDGTILAASPTAVRRLATPGQRLEGRKLEELVSYAGTVGSPLFSSLGEHEVRTRQVRVVRDDGERTLSLHAMRRGGVIECVLETDRGTDRIEQELIEQKQWFEELFENTPLAIIMADATDCVLAVNPAFEQLFGWSAAEIAGKPLNELLAPDGYEAEASALSRAAFAGEPVSAETVRRHRQGRLVPVRVYGVPVLADGMRLGVYGIYVDMTGRKQVEEALRQYARRLEGMQRLDRAILAARSDHQLASAALTTLRSLIACDRMSVLLYEQSSGTARVVAASDDAALGPAAGETIELSALTESGQLEQGPVRYLEDLSAIGEDLTPTAEMLLQAGVRSVLTLPLRSDGELVGELNIAARRAVAFDRDHIVVAREVADQLAIALRQVRMAAELAEERRRLGWVIGHLPEAVVLLDASHRVILANPRAEGDLLRLGISAEVGSVIQTVGDTTLDELLRGEELQEWHEVTVGTPQTGVFELCARPLAEGESRGSVLLVVRDVTRERSVQEQLHHHGRLAAVGQLAAGIAHDMNNMLQGMMIDAELLLLEEGLGAEAMTKLRAIVDQGERGARMIRQILDFSRRSIVSREPLNLSLLLGDVVRLLERTIPENIRITTEMEEDGLYVRADAAQLQQMITNLAVNARDAMPDGGQLGLCLRRVDGLPSAAASVHPSTSGDWAELVVSDTGCGIPVGNQPRIFEPFFSTKGPGGGTGLGLSQVYGIVHQHEGFIDVQSYLEQGTAFHVYLPLHDEEMPPSTHEMTSSFEGTGELVLVVEDDPALLRVAADGLVRCGYRVVAAGSGEEALERFADRADEVDLLLSDMVMPGIDGLELAQRFADLNPTVRSVLMSGYPLRPQELHPEESGHSIWIQKPFSLDDLARTVHAALAARSGR